MKRIIALSTCLVFLFSLTSSFKSSPVKTNNWVISNYMIPVDQTVFVETEYVRFIGLIHLQTKYSPGDPYRVQTNLVSMKGTGLSSGLDYFITGSAFSEEPGTAGSTINFSHVYRFLPPSPISPTDPYFDYTVEFDSMGQIVAATAELHIGIVIVEG